MIEMSQTGSFYHEPRQHLFFRLPLWQQALATTTTGNLVSHGNCG
jgi:hypothetical protein